jgi:hypothetical protein
MIIKNKLDITFGPFGSSTGLFLTIGGLIATYFSIFGCLIAIIGAFAAFTSTSTSIDTDNRKIKYSDNLFGIIPIGKWIDIKPDMKLGLKRSHRGFVGYIRGNQPVDIHNNDIRVILYDSSDKMIMPVKKSDSVETSRNDLHNLSTLLELQIVR